MCLTLHLQTLEKSTTWFLCTIMVLSWNLVVLQFWFFFKCPELWLFDSDYFFKYGEPVVLCSLILMLFKNLEPTVIRKIKDLRLPEKKSLKSGNYGSLCFFPHKNPLYDCTWLILGANWQNLTIENRKLMAQQAGFFFLSCFLVGLGFKP